MFKTQEIIQNLKIIRVNQNKNRMVNKQTKIESTDVDLKLVPHLLSVD